MNLFEKAKASVRSVDGTEYELSGDGLKGRFSAKSDEVSTTVSLIEKKNGELSTFYVKGELKGGCFSAEKAISIVFPLPDDIYGYMADYQSCDHWCRPAFGKTSEAVPDRTQALLYKKNDGRFGFLFPLVGEDYKAELRGTPDGIEMYIFANVSDMSKCSTPALIAGEGAEPYKLMKDCASLAVKLLDNGVALREERRYPEIFEYLGWCSWDALEIRVSTEGLLAKCREMKEKKIPFKWAIIDDMWAECDNLRDIPDDLTRETGMFKVMHSSKLRSFEADPKRFPTGLADCLTKMKKYGLKIGIWHPTSGYWAGIDPDSPLAEKYKELLVTVPNGRLMPSPETDKAFMFYSAFHDFLKSCGTDFVKIDNQGFLMYNYKNYRSLGSAARNIQRAVCASVGSHFDNNIINCMGMASENMLCRPSGAISRCSGDFQPENREWFIRHILACGYNSLIQGMFYWSDFDMWWTDDEQALKNSVIRAISGGPVYVSDKIGRSRPEIFKPLCFSDGRLLRCETPAVPTLDCLVDDPEKSGRIFKMKNVYPRGGVVAALNLDAENSPVSGSVSASDIGQDYERFAVYEHFSGETVILEKGGKLDVTLRDHDDIRLYTIVPVENGVGVLGLIDKFNSPLAITDEFDGVYSIREGGEFAFVTADGKKRAAVSESGRHTVRRNGILNVVSLPLKDRHIRIE